MFCPHYSWAVGRRFCYYFTKNFYLLCSLSPRFSSSYDEFLTCRDFIAISITGNLCIVLAFYPLVFCDPDHPLQVPCLLSLLFCGYGNTSQSYITSRFGVHANFPKIASINALAIWLIFIFCDRQQHVLQKILCKLHTHTNYAVTYPYRNFIVCLTYGCIISCHLFYVQSSGTCKRDTWKYLVPGSYWRPVTIVFLVPLKSQDFAISVTSFGRFFFSTTLHTCLRNYTHHYLISICSCMFLQTFLISLWQCNIWILNEDTSIFWETYWISLFSAGTVLVT